jgi:hypothetical protein
MNPTLARDRATKLALTDTEAALKVARQIDDPWFACQALAWVARFAPNQRAQTIAKRALSVGRNHPDPYKSVACAAWPVRALIETGNMNVLMPILGKLMKRAATIESAVSRSEALLLLLQAVLPARRTVWKEVLSALITASQPCLHWRQRRNLRDALLMVASRDSTVASDAMHRIADQRTRTQIERRLAQGELAAPRAFFWSEGAPR